MLVKMEGVGPQYHNQLHALIASHVPTLSKIRVGYPITEYPSPKVVVGEMVINRPEFNP